MLSEKDVSTGFAGFVEEVEPRLKRALTARLGRDVGLEATQDALVYGWEHWDRVRAMENPAGYLYRVGCSRARRYRRPKRLFPSPPEARLPWIEPGLSGALERLSERQRTVVMLVHGYGWPVSDVADMLGSSWSTVRRHADRGVAKLQRYLGAGS
jgi:RNA polymerase sigma-70 factor (ECF subfamily)